MEDNTATSELVCSVIRAKYPELVLRIAYNGREGLALFRRLGADIVLTDINMPQMDGITMAQEIRRLAADVAIIAISACSPCPSDASCSIVDHYLQKPLMYRQLFAVLDISLARLRASRPSCCP